MEVLVGFDEGFTLEALKMVVGPYGSLFVVPCFSVKYSLTLLSDAGFLLE